MATIRQGSYVSKTPTSLYGSGLSFSGRSNTLDDLENNDEFQEIAERFLESVGEKSDDIFEYLRDSKYNLYSGMKRAMKSGKFSDQEKQDYKYLSSRFENADMGSFRQYLELIKDVSLDIVTDPTAILAVLTTPISGGTSLAARQGAVTAALQGTKAIAKNNLKNIGKKQIYKSAALTGAEVGGGALGA